jgi:Mg2+-importing ATPase
VDEIPFDFSRRRMSVAVADQSGKCQLITKGAIEEMLSVCAYAEYQGSVQPLSAELRRVVLEKVNDFNRRGFRVLGIAHKKPALSPEKKTYAVADEADMVLIGYLAFLDPPKESSRQAIAKLQEYGVYVKILTGDNDAVTRYICSQVGIDASRTLLGPEIEGMPDEELSRRIGQTSVFAKLTPDQKTRIVSLLRKKHVVGFMGDGINDAAAMKAADAGISVDTAVDIAKESADIILTEKDLNVLGDGIIEGRRTYANTIKYIKMTSSSNFGNMFSILAACIFLPFLPMLPIQLLILNMIYDISCLALPFDNVDADYLKMPRQWDASSVEKFMLWFGPASSVFDITTYLVMFFLICPQMFHGSYAALPPEKQLLFAALFQAGWFVESQWTQTLVIHTLRTEKTPVLQSMASLPVCVLSGLGILISTLLACVIGFGNGPQPLPLSYFVYLLLVIVLYSLLVSLIKKAFIRKYGACCNGRFQDRKKF